MKRILHTVIVSAAIFSCGIYAGAQDYVAPPVTVSKEKVKVDGKVFYSHVVLERQTLFSIGQAYGVSIDDIYEANPSLRENGLKKNAIILIPAAEKQQAKDQKDKEAKEIREKETKESKEKDAKEPEETAKSTKKNAEWLIHTVKWYEDIDGIAKKYGTTADVIIEINGLTSRKLSNRQKLKIPADPQAYIESRTQEAAHDQQVWTVPSWQAPDGHDETVSEVETVKPAHTAKSSIAAVLMLPFNASEEKQNESCMDFYSGALLAVRELGNTGLDIDLSVYDTGGGVLPITADRLRRSDVVIGPVSSRELSSLLAKTPEGTFIVSPLDHNADSIAVAHDNFIQAPSPTIAQYEDLALWVKEDKAPEDHVIVIHEKGQRSSAELAVLQNKLQENGVKYSDFNYSILEGRNIQSSLSSIMTANGCNRVVIVSESEAFVNEAIRNLNLLVHNKYSVTLYGASKIRSFETIDAENLHNTNFHVSFTYYIDYDDPRVKTFLMQYRALYNTEPTRFAFQGYDSMHYFCTAAAKYGDAWPEMLTENPERMLQTDFRFVKQGENGGYANMAVRRVIYGPDYSIRLAGQE